MNTFNYRIVNVVGSSKTSKIDLALLKSFIENSRYLRTGKHGVYYKSPRYNTTVCIYRSGKIAFRGAKSIEDAKSTIKELLGKLKTEGLLFQIILRSM